MIIRLRVYYFRKEVIKIKLTREFIKKTYSLNGPVSYYTEAVVKVGLWESEKIVFQKYLMNKDTAILDIGCGAGRAAFGLYRLGYHNITGMDISGAMVEKARYIAKKLKFSLSFHEGDIVTAPFNDGTFGLAVFSFNGLMQIPGIENRIKAMKEVKRILKPNGYFIFSTHDRDRQAEWKEFWETETKKWQMGDHDPALFELGDRIINGKAKDEKTYLHFPNRWEIIYSINKSGLSYVEDLWRGDLCTEPEAVRKFAYDCRFWIARKKA